MLSFASLKRSKVCVCVRVCAQAHTQIPVSREREADTCCAVLLAILVFFVS